MLIATPKHWYSWDFVVRDEGEQAVGELKVSSRNGRGTIAIGGIVHQVRREGLRGDFLLEREGSILARAAKPSAFMRTLTIEYEQRTYTLRARTSLRREMVFFDGEIEAGTLAPKGHFPWRACVDLPDGLPLELRMFVTWLTMMLWKRQAES